jgi:tRNA(Ile)-lysidine synthase
LTTHIESRIRAMSLFGDGQRILVAVSGGLDSMVLLALLHRLSKIHRWKLTVAHFNHQLRGAVSDADEQLARKTARKLHLPFAAGRADVRGTAKKNGTSIEMAARHLRHDFLAATALKLKIPTVALAHHADDQVELFFLRLLRGAGGDGLAGMKWTNPSPNSPKIRLARPLLDAQKADLDKFARENKLSFNEDATNSSIDIQRNRLRHELIPLLTRHYQPSLARAVLRSMDLVGAEAEFAADAARRWLKDPRAPIFDRLPLAVQRRAIHQQLLGLKLTPDFDLIERLRLSSGQWIAVNPECAVSRNADGLVHPKQVKAARFSPRKRKVSFSAGKGELSFGGLKIRWESADDNGMDFSGKPANVEYFDAEKVGSPVCLRFWQAGDRFQPIGAKSARKLQDLFTNLKVPPGERRRRVIAATSQGELFWVEGLRMAEKFKLDKHTVRKLKWRWRRNPAPPSS